MKTNIEADFFGNLEFCVYLAGEEDLVQRTPVCYARVEKKYRLRNVLAAKGITEELAPEMTRLACSAAQEAYIVDDTDCFLECHATPCPIDLDTAIRAPRRGRRAGRSRGIVVISVGRTEAQPIAAGKESNPCPAFPFGLGFWRRYWF
jgi:hypothetical protein